MFGLRYVGADRSINANLCEELGQEAGVDVYILLSHSLASLVQSCKQGVTLTLPKAVRNKIGPLADALGPARDMDVR
jgi:hypothetical protein